MPKLVLGVDVGTSGVKMVLMKKSASPQIIGYSIVPLPEGAFDDGQIANVEVVAGAMKECYQALGVKGRPSVYACLSGQNVITRFITMPNMSDEELSGTIWHEAEQYIPYSLEEISLSFERLADLANDSSNQVFLLLVCAQKEQIGNFMMSYQMSGLKPSVLDVDSFAVINAMHHAIPDSGVVAVIDIGAGTTNINILKDGVLQFTRNIPIAGNNITMVIQSVLKLDYEEAERVKQEEGLVVVEEEENEVSEVVRTITEEMAVEIRRSFDYYKASSREHTIDKIILSGGTAKLKNIELFLANELGIEVENGDALGGCEVAVTDQDELCEKVYELSTAIGLGMRGVTE